MNILNRISGFFKKKEKFAIARNGGRFYVGNYARTFSGAVVRVTKIHNLKHVEVEYEDGVCDDVDPRDLETIGPKARSRKGRSDARNKKR